MAAGECPMTAGELAVEKVRRLQASGQAPRYQGKSPRAQKWANRKAARNQVAVKVYIGESAMRHGVIDMAAKGYRVQSTAAVKRGIPIFRFANQKLTVVFEKA